MCFALPRWLSGGRSVLVHELAQRRRSADAAPTSAAARQDELGETMIVGATFILFHVLAAGAAAQRHGQRGRRRPRRPAKSSLARRWASSSLSSSPSSCSPNRRASANASKRRRRRRRAMSRSLPKRCSSAPSSSSSSSTRHRRQDGGRSPTPSSDDDDGGFRPETAWQGCVPRRRLLRRRQSRRFRLRHQADAPGRWPSGDVCDARRGRWALGLGHRHRSVRRIDLLPSYSLPFLDRPRQQPNRRFVRRRGACERSRNQTLELQALS